MDTVAKINRYFKECFEKSQTFIGLKTIRDIDSDVVNRITDLIPNELASYLNDDNYIVRGSVGKGLATKTPWIAILDKEITTTTRNDVYIVFLFSSDYKNVYLTLNQGTTELEKFGNRLNKKNIEKRTQEIRELLNIKNDLLFTDSKAKIADERYLAGAIYYSLWDESDNEKGKELLQLYLDLYNLYKQYKSENRNDPTKKLHFEVQLKKSLRSDHSKSVVKPSQFPSFVLVFNDDWNDYSYRTWFCLYYYGEDKVQHRIGEFKLMCRDKVNTYDELNEKFDGALSDNFCSLGIEPSYYSNMYKLFKGSLIMDQLLYSLRDCAYDQNIYEEFKEDDAFKSSLLREDSSSQAINEASYLLSGGNKAAAYSFSVHFAPEYLKGAFTEWQVKLLNDAPSFMRMVGLIGDNGVGKTQILKNLIGSLTSPECPLEPLPLFRSCLAINSTPFDRYDDIKGPYRIHYHNFTFEQNRESTEKKIVSCIDIINQRPLINKQPMIQLYKESLDNILGPEIGDAIININDYSLNKKGLHEQINIMSSGQLHILQLLTFIHAYIKLSTLLVIDEPEVHMHPQFVVLFMAMLGRILSNFRSFAVIATHSPLVIREMARRNVYHMNIVEGNIPHIGKVSFETFGADASELYLSIFHYDERMSSFYYYIRDLGKKKSYDEAISYIMKYAPELSLNARLSIRDYLEQKEDA